MGFEVSLGGFVVGLLIGLTGMGGGILMTPLLIFLFGVSPTVAVGTDLIYASVTKMFGAWQHWKQKTIDFTVVKWLVAGSLPGALFGVWVVMQLQSHLDTHQLNTTIGRILGFAYLLISGVMLWRVFQMRKGNRNTVTDLVPPKRKLVILGAVGGVLVGITSVGSGTLFMAILTMIYPVASAKLVGTDIVQAIFVTGVAGIAHFTIGNVDLFMVLMLLTGSIPGILLGSKLTTRIPDLAVRTALMLMLVLSGVKLLH